MYKEGIYLLLNDKNKKCKRLFAVNLDHVHELLRPDLHYAGLNHFCSRLMVAVFKDLVLFLTSWIWSSAVRGVPAPDFWPSYLNWSILLYTSQSLKFTDGPESCRLSFGWKNQCYYFTVHCCQLIPDCAFANSELFKMSLFLKIVIFFFCGLP